jgi:hypothetical protein
MSEVTGYPGIPSSRGGLLVGCGQRLLRIDKVKRAVRVQLPFLASVPVWTGGTASGGSRAVSSDRGTASGGSALGSASGTSNVPRGSSFSVTGRKGNLICKSSNLSSGCTKGNRVCRGSSRTSGGITKGRCAHRSNSSGANSGCIGGGCLVGRSSSGIVANGGCAGSECPAGRSYSGIGASSGCTGGKGAYRNSNSSRSGSSAVCARNGGLLESTGVTGIALAALAMLAPIERLGRNHRILDKTGR